MKKTFMIINLAFFLIGILLILGVLQPLLFMGLAKLIGHYPGVRVEGLLKLGGLFLVLTTIIIQIIYWSMARNREKLESSFTKISFKIRNWFKAKLGSWVEFEEPKPKPLRFNYLDIIIVLLIVIFSLGFTLAQLQTDYPYVKLDSDAANIASFMAAKDFPNNFNGDFLLGNPGNFALYYSVLMPLLHWLQPVVGSYSMAMMILLGPTVLIFLFGLYLLGRVVFNSRFWSLFFTIINVIPLVVTIDNVGLLNDPLPRFIFQALIPYVLILIWIWREKPARWIIPTILIGAMVYVHPVSAPSWIAGIFLGFILLIPKDWSRKKKVGLILLLFGILVILIAPYAFIYISNRRVVTTTNYDLIMWLFTRIFPAQLLQPGTALSTFTIMMTQIGLFPLAVIGLFFIWLLQKDHKGLVLILAWSIGILCVSTLLPFVERNIENIFHLSPIENELIRGIKNLVLLLILLGVWFLKVFYKNIKNLVMRFIPVFVGVILFILIFNSRAFYTVNFVPLFNCLGSGKLICGSMSDQDQVMLAVKDKIPTGGRIFFSRDAFDNASTEIRYIALHPLVYSWIDKGIFYTAPEYLDEWYAAYQTLVDEGDTTGWYQRDPNAFLDFAKNLGAQYVILEKPKSQNSLNVPNSQIIFQNQTFLLFQLTN